MKRSILLCLLVLFMCSPSWAVQKHEADVVVLGGGFSGLAAAVSSAEGGLKVILLEKAPALGGASNFVEGSFAVESVLNKKLGKGISKEDAFRGIMNFHHWRVNSSMIQEMVGKSGNTIQWLMDMGVEFDGIKTSYQTGSNWTWHMYKGAGQSAVKALSNKFVKLGGVILTETPGRELMVKNGVVVGVKGYNLADDEDVEVYAKAVVLATGGYSANKTILNKYIPGFDKMGMICMGPVPDVRTGDGILMAEKIGAKLVTMEVLEASGPFLPVEPAVKQQVGGTDEVRHLKAALLQPFLWVNGRGERFIDESLASDWAITHNALMQNDGKMFTVMSEEHKKMLMEKGTLLPNSDFIPKGTKLVALDRAFANGMAAVGASDGKPYVFKGATIEELAQKMGVDPKSLKQTIADLNKYVKNGKDEEFQRTKGLLYSFDKGPYYAIRGIPSYFSTLGGVRINKNAQAIDENDLVIDGLYAVGHDMGGMYGDTYDLIMEGSSSSFALNSGRIAGEHIILSLKKK